MNDNSIRFFISLRNPPTITHQEHKVRVINGKPVFYDPPELKEAKMLFMSRLIYFKPTRPLEGPLRLTTKWIWDKGLNHQNGEYKTTKPDTDNMIKLFKDCMTACGYWKDDAQVASEITEKFWGFCPGIYVEIEGIKEAKILYGCS